MILPKYTSIYVLTAKMSPKRQISTIFDTLSAVSNSKSKRRKQWSILPPSRIDSGKRLKSDNTNDVPENTVHPSFAAMYDAISPKTGPAEFIKISRGYGTFAHDAILNPAALNVIFLIFPPRKCAAAI